MEKVLGFCKRNSKALIVSMMVAMLAVCSAISSSAVDEQVSTAFSSALDTMTSDVLQLILLAVPAGLGVLSVVLAIKAGIKLVRGLIGKS